MTPEEFPEYLVPRITPDSAEFWAGTTRAELRVQRCADCELHHHYPRSVCPHCGSDRLEWITAAGTGTVHSFTVIRQHGIPPFHEAVPYVVALVDLDEAGARVLGRMPDLDPHDASIGLRVDATFAPATDRVAFVEFTAAP